MKTHSHFASRILGILTIAAAVGWLQPADASAQTAEGVVINNVAFVTYTDANDNTYGTENGNVLITVGHLAGVDVFRAQATATPLSPSSNNTMDFDLINVGNGTDSMSVAEGISDGAVITVVKYTLNASDYFSLVDLNVALAGTAIAALGTETITVTYDVPGGQGGQPSTYTLTGTSRRNGTATDNDNTVVTPGLTGSVATTPDGGQLLTELPSGPGNPTYTFTFNVANNQTGMDDFDLVASSPGPVVISIVSVDGVPGTTATITNLAASDNQDILVVYTVADVAAGSVDTLFLDATAVNGSATDQGFADLTVVKASLSITKEAWEDDESAPLSANVLPGDFFKYKVIVTNGGTADASSVHVDDDLPPQVSYVLATGDVAGWSFVESSGDVDADLAGTLIPAATRFFWIRVQVN